MRNEVSVISVSQGAEQYVVVYCDLVYCDLVDCDLVD